MENLLSDRAPGVKWSYVITQTADQAQFLLDKWEHGGNIRNWLGWLAFYDTRATSL